jgi:hypothetical protein
VFYRLNNNITSDTRLYPVAWDVTGLSGDTLVTLTVTLDMPGEDVLDWLEGGGMQGHGPRGVIGLISFQKP